MPPMYSRSNENLPDPMRKVRPGLAFVAMIFCALIAFEIFNFTTTEHALADLLGNLTFVSIPWSTILAVAFCGIDFAGIARLFTPEQGLDEPKEVWYLFGAWLLAATMNAILTWWGVSMAVVTNQVQSTAIVDPKTLTNVVPVFVAVMVWVIRILIIGTLSLSMDRLMHPDQVKQQRTLLENAMPSHWPAHERAPQDQRATEQRASRTNETAYPYPSSLGNNAYNQRPPASRAASPNRTAPSPRPTQHTPASGDDDMFNDTPSSSTRSRGEPTYHRLGEVSARPSGPGGKKIS